MSIVKFNNKQLLFNNKLVNWSTPIVLPPYTMRLKYRNGFTPTFASGNAVQISSSPNIWDLTYENPNWKDLLNYYVNTSHTNLLEVMGANTTNVTSMFGLFDHCNSMTSVSLFDTSNVERMDNMFAECSALTSVPFYDTSKATHTLGMFNACTSLRSIPLYDTSNVINMYAMFAADYSLSSIPLLNTDKVIDMSYMYAGCYKVENGLSAFYQQVSTQATIPEYHEDTFYNCGRDTIQGAAELALIPSDWK